MQFHCDIVAQVMRLTLWLGRGSRRSQVVECKGTIKVLLALSRDMFTIQLLIIFILWVMSVFSARTVSHCSVVWHLLRCHLMT